MTAVKQKLFDLLPEMPSLIPAMTDETAEQIFNIFVTIKREPERHNPNIVHNNSKRKLGIADGMYNIPDSIDDCKDEIARMFGVSE